MLQQGAGVEFISWRYHHRRSYLGWHLLAHYLDEGPHSRAGLPSGARRTTHIRGKERILTRHPCEKLLKAGRAGIFIRRHANGVRCRDDTPDDREKIDHMKLSLPLPSLVEQGSND